MNSIHRLRRPLVILLVVILLTGIAAVYVATRIYWRPLVTEAAFETAYAAGDRAGVVDLYQLALEERNQAPEGSERQIQADAVADLVEKTIASEAASRFDKIANGAVLSADDRDFFTIFDTLSTNALLDAFVAYTYKYLSGSYSDEEMRHMLDETLQIDVVYQTYGRVENEHDAMIAARPKIAEAEALMAASSWLDATRKWEQLQNDRSMSHFTLGYIEARAEEARENLLSETIRNVSFLLEQQKYYSARELLNVILPIFPYDAELLNFNVEADAHLPKSFSTWDLPVDHIAVRPLIADAEKAFAGNRYAEANDRFLLLAGEFQAMLKALYDNGYVLVSDDAFITAGGKFKAFSIPEGKKPLVLVFDSFHFAATRSLAGTIDRLVLDGEDGVTGALIGDDGAVQPIKDGDAVSILEAFIRDYPDFSFNGAKATIAVTGQYGLFGYVLNPAQAILKNEQRAMNGMAPVLLNDEQIEAERTDAKAVADRLRLMGYQFASNTYGDLNLPDVTVDAIREDDQLFKAVLGPFLGELRTFSYPGGRHVNTVSEKTSLLVQLGYSRLLAHGTIAYFAYGDGYTHMDMNLAGGDALRNPTATRFDRYFDTSRIIDYAKRP
ncbi:MAG TPA: hypothetical protein GXZ64_00670 [Clostridiaceae bacterium]|nr:hypothetical protein [Clostridiaceae bacterium]